MYKLNSKSFKSEYYNENLYKYLILSTSTINIINQVYIEFKIIFFVFNKIIA